MKLDATVMRTMNRQDFRVLAAVEKGMRNHALVPAKLISSLASLRHGGTGKILSSLLRDKLLSHDQSCGYDGYRLTNSGYDILALHNLKTRKLVTALGDRIGTGKESDIYVAANAEGQQIVLKLHRLGRTSFRDVKKKRDYFQVNQHHHRSHYHRSGGTKSQPNSWLFLSKISALKEYAFMKALHQVDYPTPLPLGQNRHIVVMSLVRGMPLYQIPSSRVSPAQAESIFQQSTRLATRLAQHGLVHCDLNEFNLMVDLSGIQDNTKNEVGEHYVRHSGKSVASKGALSAHLQQFQPVDGTGEFVTEAPPEPKELLETGEPRPVVTLIDFPQMVSTHHPNAKELYDRDLQCLKRFFVMKLKCIPEDGWDDLIPSWEQVTDFREEDNLSSIATKAQTRLDEELQASGFSEQDASRDMELYYYQHDPSRTLKEKPRNENYSDHDSIPDDEEEEAVCGETDCINEQGSDSENEDTDAQWEVDTPSLGGDSVFSEASRAHAEATARQKVQQHMQNRKKRNGRKNAFRSRNSNKTYVKGKRVFNDIVL